MRSKPIWAYPRSVVAVVDRKLNPSSEPENEAVDLAVANSARNAAGSVGGTPRPCPRRCGAPVAFHWMVKLNVAGTGFGPPNWKLSSTDTFLASMVARLPSLLTWMALSGSWTIQNSPEGWMPPLKSCT